MPLSWHDLRVNILRSSSTLGSQRQFAAITVAHPALSRFRDHIAMLDYLHHSKDTPDAKNTVLSALVFAAQTKEPFAQHAQSLLLLALWPGLDAVRQRVIGRWRLFASDAVSDVLVQASKAITAIDTTKVNRIAATILRNIERDIGRAVLRENGLHRYVADQDPDELSATDPAGEDDAHGITISDLGSLIGRDAKLVLLVAVEGLTQAEAGAVIGISEAAARKRFQRATRKLQEKLH